MSERFEPAPPPGRPRELDLFLGITLVFFVFGVIVAVIMYWVVPALIA